MTGIVPSKFRISFLVPSGNTGIVNTNLVNTCIVKYIHWYRTSKDIIVLSNHHLRQKHSKKGIVKKRLEVKITWTHCSVDTMCT